MQSLEEVVARVRENIRLLHYALSTEDTYCSWVARYYTYCPTPLTRVNPSTPCASCSVTPRLKLQLDIATL